MEKRNRGVKRLTNGYSIETAVEFLDDNLKDIPDVKTWAEKMCYSRSHFSTKIKEHFGKPPSEMLRHIRIKNVQKKIKMHPRKNSYAIADMVGLKTDDALYHFLSNHLDTNFTDLKDELLKRRGQGIVNK